MKERILTGWSFSRALYLVIGSLVVIQSFMEKEWLGVAFGGYFASMGIFAFGCASGSCYTGNCNATSAQKSNTDLQQENVEELKVK